MAPEQTLEKPKGKFRLFGDPNEVQVVHLKPDKNRSNTLEVDMAPELGRRRSTFLVKSISKSPRVHGGLWDDKKTKMNGTSAGLLGVEHDSSDSGSMTEDMSDDEAISAKLRDMQMK